MEVKTLQKKYGLLTAICMVIGIVIGSGVFFKAEKVLNITNGNLGLGILAWFIGGLIMVACAYVFSVMATRYEKVNGIIDYSEVTVGENYGYLVGWFMTIVYYPCLASVLAWVSARYTCVLFGWDIFGGECMVISCFYLCISYVVNALSPKLSGKLQVSMTIIKLIPLILMAIVGTIAGLSNGILFENFKTVAQTGMGRGSALLSSVVATSFAYDGWIVATSINSELRDSKRNLPLALLFGTIIVLAIYILYYVGLAGAVPNAVIMSEGENGVKVAFSKLFSTAGGTILSVLVVISCLGTLNGLMVASTRGMYAISARNLGPHPKALASVDSNTDMPSSSTVVGLGLCAFWLLYFFGFAHNWLGKFGFDISEIPIVSLYAMYIPIFIRFMAKEKDLGVFQRWVAPVAGVVACGFMVYAAIVSHKIAVVFYLITFVIIELVGWGFKDSAKRHPERALPGLKRR